MNFSIRALCSAVFALGCIGAACAQPSASTDAIYLALGQGDMAKAAELSAALLERTPDDPAAHADALSARLDVLDARGELNAPVGASLHETIEKTAAKDSLIAELFAIESALAAHQAKQAAQQAQDLLAASRQLSKLDVAVLRSVQARAASRVDGQRPQALAPARAALTAWGALPGKRSALAQIELHYIIGNVHDSSGDKNEAVREFEAGAALATAEFGADSQARLKIDTDRASTLVQLGRNGDAQALREGIFTATRQRFGDNSLQAAKAEAMVGAGLQEIGDYPAARQRYDHAEQTLAAIEKPDPREAGIISANFGNLLQEMGEEDAALAHYRHALEAWADEPQANHVRAVVSANIGNTEFRQHRYEAAIADFEHAVTLRELADGKDNPGLGFALEGLGSASLALKRYADAQRYFARALEVRGRSLPPNHPTLAVFNFGLALAHWGQHHSDEAFRYAATTAENQHALLGTFATEFSERQSVAYRDILVPATALVVTLAAERGDAQSIATAWRLTMVERGLVARAQARRLAAARSATNPELAQAWAAWRQANSALGEAWLGTGTTPEQMAELRAAAENAERALWRKAGRDADGTLAKDSSLADLAGALPADGVLLAFTEGVAGDTAGALAAGDKPAPEDWYAFTLDKRSTPKLQRVGNIEALSAQVRAWYRDLRDPASDLATIRRNGIALRHALLDPFVRATADRHLFVIPDGEVFRVSFAALPSDTQGYLIESGVRMHTLDHESDLALPAPAGGAANALLAGAPDFPQMEKGLVASRQLCLRATRQGFAAIPNAARELDELQALFAPATSAHVDVVAGAAATKERVLAALPQANIIHLATHGFSLDGSCADTGATRGVTLDEAKSSATAANTSALSGLAFSGAEIGSGREPVGVLSAGEISTLDLSHADWVALSACDSGLGPIGRNEGVFGMRRALRLAGARSVVMSLWQVDDAATADLMQALYRTRFVDHTDVPAAMTQAMQSVLKARRTAGQSDHPYYWAAFIAEGGWR